MSKLDFLPYIEKLKADFSSLSLDLADKTSKISNFGSADFDPLTGKQFSKSEILKIIESGTFSKRHERIFWKLFFQYTPQELDSLNISWTLSHSKIEQIIHKNLDFHTLNSKNFSFLDKWNIRNSHQGGWIQIGSIESLRVLAKGAFEAFIKKQLPSLNRTYTKVFLRELIGFQVLKNINDQTLDLFFSALENYENKPFVDFQKIVDGSKVDTSYYQCISALLAVFAKSSKFKERANSTLLYLKTTIAFQDPRANPLSIHWDKIKAITPDYFRIWQKSFNEEDILFFFQNLNKKDFHPERREFWLDYKNSANDVLIVLDQPKRNTLIARFSDDEKSSSIIQRSKQYKSPNSREQYLIFFFFDSHVLIEGSQGGFACQLYDKSVFLSRFGHSVFSESKLLKETNFSDFRGEGSGRKDSWSHVGDWQREFQKKLRQLGIYPT